MIVHGTRATRALLTVLEQVLDCNKLLADNSSQTSLPVLGIDEAAFYGW